MLLCPQFDGRHRFAVTDLLATRRTRSVRIAEFYDRADEIPPMQISQRTRRAIIEECLLEPRKPGSGDIMRNCPVNALSSAHVKMLRDRKAAMPGAANQPAQMVVIDVRLGCREWAYANEPSSRYRPPLICQRRLSCLDR